MSDFEETNYSWLTQLTPQKRKKDKKRLKCKNNSVKIDETTPKKKKKKNSKSKEGSAKKKIKKKKKNRLSLDAARTLRTSTPRSHDRPAPDCLTPGSEKKSKTKKVKFEVSPCNYRIKRPKFASPPPYRPIKAPAPAPAQCGDGASCSEPRQLESEDACSQDLFITQKTFRASPAEPSSGEYSAITMTPQKFLESYRTKQHLIESLSQQYGSKAAEHGNKPKTEVVKDGLQKGNLDQSSEVNPHLPEPIDLSPSSSSRKLTKPWSQRSVRSTATQTENLFTFDITSYLSFCQKAQTAGLLEHFRPLDLSLPDRARRDLGTCVSPAPSKGDDPRNPGLCPSTGSEKVKEELSCLPQDCENAKSKGETTASSQSESDPRSADASTSSEESHSRPDTLAMPQVLAEPI